MTFTGVKIVVMFFVLFPGSLDSIALVDRIVKLVLNKTNEEVRDFNELFLKPFSKDVSEDVSYYNGERNWQIKII